ncbi:hypothetical protein DFH09DRAFT_63722 [Mycena vulgaris]|nr:hypothetical protein DFH09DRAFT_63722 [Mycena vulgaris]
MAACTNLHTLRLSFVDTDFTRLHACVAPFTALRALIVAVSGECRANGIPSTPLAPRLKFYRGPVALLPLVLTGAEPEGLDITHGSAGAVLDALRTAGCPEWITLLSIGVKLHTDVVSGAVLHPLLALCPRLAHLTLVISANEGVLVAVPAFHAALVEILALPRALETVAFRWRPDGVENEFVPDRAELETLLRATVPSLTHVFLNDRGHRGMAFGNFTTPV